MPFIIYIFSLCAFSIGFTEFITIGLSPSIAQDLDVSITVVSLSVTLYALGVMIGAPILTAVLQNISKKRNLFYAMAFFTLSNFIAGISFNIETLLIARFVSGLAHGVFFAIAANAATKLVSKEKSGSAIALVFGGITIAMSLGVPIGAWLSGTLSWKRIFFAISFLGFIGAVGIFLFMPIESEKQQKPTMSFNSMFNSKILSAAMIPMMSYMASFILYTFASPIVEKFISLNKLSTSSILISYGIGAAIGTAWGGKLTDKKGADKTAFILILILALSLFSAFFTMKNLILLSISIFMLGFSTYGAIPPLQSRIIKIAEKSLPQTVDIASGINIAAFNSGVVMGSFIGSIILNNLGFYFLPIAGGIIAILSATVLKSQSSDKTAIKN